MLHTESFRDNPRRLAVLHGPLVLAGEVDPSRPMPSLVADEGKLVNALKRVEGKRSTFAAPAGTFRIPGDKGETTVTLEPLWKMLDSQPYAVYWDRCTPPSGRQRKRQRSRAPDLNPDYSQ